MAKIIGRLIDLGVGKEGVRGAGVLPTFWIPKANITFDDRTLKARSVVNFGNINLEGNQELVAMRHSEGTIDFDMFDDSIGIFLLNIFGAVQSGSVVCKNSLASNICSFKYFDNISHIILMPFQSLY